MRVTDPVIRREVRNAHYNLGHPSTATLLRIMRRSGASDAAQRYARWWKCPLCAQRQAPRALNPTTAPYRQHVQLDDRLRRKGHLRRERVEVRCTQHRRPRHWLQILAVLDGPRCWRAPALSWAQTEPLPAILLHFRCKVYTLAGMPRQHDSLAEWSKALGCSTAAVWMSIPVAWLAASAAT